MLREHEREHALAHPEAGREDEREHRNDEREQDGRADEQRVARLRPDERVRAPPDGDAQDDQSQRIPAGEREHLTAAQQALERLAAEARQQPVRDRAEQPRVQEHEAERYDGHDPDPVAQAEVGRDQQARRRARAQPEDERLLVDTRGEARAAAHAGLATEHHAPGHHQDVAGDVAGEDGARPHVQQPAARQAATREAFEDGDVAAPVHEQDSAQEEQRSDEPGHVDVPLEGGDDAPAPGHAHREEHDDERSDEEPADATSPRAAHAAEDSLGSDPDRLARSIVDASGHTLSARICLHPI